MAGSVAGYCLAELLSWDAGHHGISEWCAGTVCPLLLHSTRAWLQCSMFDWSNTLISSKEGIQLNPSICWRASGEAGTSNIFQLLSLQLLCAVSDWIDELRFSARYGLRSLVADSLVLMCHQQYSWYCCSSPSWIPGFSGTTRREGRGCPSHPDVLPRYMSFLHQQISNVLLFV